MKIFSFMIISFFIHENMVFIHENIVIMHGNFIFSCINMKFSYHDYSCIKLFVTSQLSVIDESGICGEDHKLYPRVTGYFLSCLDRILTLAVSL